MKKNLKIYGMALMCLISLSIGCSKDSYNIQETQKDKSTVVSQCTITGAEALAIGQKLATSLSSITGKTVINYGTIDYSEIKNVINNNGKENYTFRIKNHPESSETVFFNLVMTQREGYTTVMLMKYEMDADFAKAYYTESKSFSKFGGTVTTSLISSNDPCPPVVVPPIVIPYGGYPPDTTPDQGSDDNGLPSIPLFTILDANDNNDSNTGTGTGTPNTGTAPAAENNNCCPWAQRGNNFRIAVNNGDDAEDPCPKDNTAGILSPEALESFNNFTTSLYNNQFDWLNAYENHVTRITLFHYLYDNNFDDESIAFAKDMINFYMEDDWGKKIKLAVSSGITNSAELVHKIYSKLTVIANNHPSSITYINKTIDGFKLVASPFIDTNPSTCSWTDLFNMWLFELGPNPLSFYGNTNTTLSLKGQEGVSETRAIAIAQIQNNDLNPISHGWTYGQGAFYDGMANGNIATSFLGSYTTKISITTLPNGQHQLHFIVSNPSTWDSATRLRIDNDHNGVHDGIFPNHIRNENNTLHLGGNFNQVWYWTETVN